jgi:hypothetical protein
MAGKKKGKFRMVAHHAAQNHRHSKQAGHGGGRKKALIKSRPHKAGG